MDLSPEIKSKLEALMATAVVVDKAVNEAYQAVETARQQLKAAEQDYLDKYTAFHLVQARLGTDLCTLALGAE